MATLCEPHQYCTITGLTSEAGQKLNGSQCYVVKPADSKGERMAVLLLDKLRTDESDFMSLKPINLVPTFGVRVAPSTIPNAELGLFATRDIAVGELILSEPSFLSVPPEAKGTSAAAFRSWINRHTTAPEREVLSSLTCKGPPPGSDVFNYADEHTEAGRWILRFVVNSASGPMEKDAHFFPVSSRSNHSCQGKNAWRTSVNGTAVLQAMRDIKAGEEIFVQYRGTPQSLELEFGVPQSSCRCAMCRGLCAKEERQCDVENATLNKLSPTPATIAANPLRAAEAVAAAAERCERAYCELHEALLSKGVVPHTIEPIKLNIALPLQTQMLFAIAQQMPLSTASDDDVRLVYALLKEGHAKAKGLTSLITFGNKHHPLYVTQKAAFDKMLDIARERFAGRI